MHGSRSRSTCIILTTLGPSRPHAVHYRERLATSHRHPNLAPPGPSFLDYSTTTSVVSRSDLHLEVFPSQLLRPIKPRQRGPSPSSLNDEAIEPSSPPLNPCQSPPVPTRITAQSWRTLCYPLLERKGVSPQKSPWLRIGKVRQALESRRNPNETRLTNVTWTDDEATIKVASKKNTGKGKLGGFKLKEKIPKLNKEAGSQDGNVLEGMDLLLCPVR